VTVDWMDASDGVVWMRSAYLIRYPGSCSLKVPGMVNPPVWGEGRARRGEPGGGPVKVVGGCVYCVITGVRSFSTTPSISL